jgi:hypothetical protein
MISRIVTHPERAEIIWLLTGYYPISRDCCAYLWLHALQEANRRETIFRRCSNQTRTEGGSKGIPQRAKPPKSSLTIITIITVNSSSCRTTLSGIRAMHAVCQLQSPKVIATGCTIKRWHKTMLHHRATATTTKLTNPLCRIAAIAVTDLDQQ